MEICNHDCFNCKFSDCINDTPTLEELTSKDTISEEVSREKKLARERSNRYAENNREKIRIASLNYYYANREKRISYSKKWCKDNHLRVNALKRKRYHDNLELSRSKQNEYRKKVRKSLPQCNECEECVLVKKTKSDGYIRLCLNDLRLVEQKVSCSPNWCHRRKELRNNESGKNKQTESV